MANITWTDKVTGNQVSAADMNEIKAAVNSKADTTALAAKADTSTVNTALDLKASLVYVDEQIAAVPGSTPGTQVTFATAIPLSRANTIMSKVMDANIVFTESATGKVSGGGGTIMLQQSATPRTVTFPAGWIAEDASDPISTTSGMWHRVIYYYDGEYTTYSVKQMTVGAVLTTPAAPTSGVVDDTADTFGFTANPSYPAANQYEKTVDGGDTYTDVTVNPISIGDVALSIGMVGVRVKAVPGVSNPSLTLYNTVAFTVSGLSTPSAPITPVSNDTTDMFGWTDTGGKTFADAEITVNGGSSYADATSNPHSVGNVLKAAGQVGVRYKAVPGVSNASATLFDTAGFNLITPAAPTSFVVDDTANTAGWTDAGGKTFADAEYTLNGGSSWADATANPQPIGNISKAAGQVGIRYKAVAGVSNASSALYNATPYLITPPAPTAGVVDDTSDTFGFTESPGFAATAHEWRADPGDAFADAPSNPIPVGNVAIAIGDLEVRVKAVAGVNTASASLANAAAFTAGPSGTVLVFPGAPAPVGGVITPGVSGYIASSEASQVMPINTSGYLEMDATSDKTTLGFKATGGLNGDRSDYIAAMYIVAGFLHYMDGVPAIGTTGTTIPVGTTKCRLYFDHTTGQFETAFWDGSTLTPANTLTNTLGTPAQMSIYLTDNAGHLDNPIGVGVV